VDFIDARDIAQIGYDAWAGRNHNERWVKLIEGTPIPNDLIVTIAEAFCELTRNHDSFL
jgi:hypothetical protein